MTEIEATFDTRSLRRQLSAIAGRFPDPIARIHRANLDRIVFDVGLVADSRGTSARVADIGGGVSLFAVGCALLGMDVTLVDDFSDPANLEYGSELLAEHLAAGVTIAERDVIAEGVDFRSQTLDAVVSFHSIEHWHSSPKRLFHNVRTTLKPGGLFVLAGPNCVNLRKRLTSVLGRAKWSAMSDWYEVEPFRGHVREPDVGDLYYIARDMELRDVRVLGRNWLGYRSRHAATRRLTKVGDRLLRPFPSLCSDIYMLGVKVE